MQFWFDPASTYSYVAAMRAEEESARAGITVEFRPFLLGPIFSAQQGIKDSPFNVNPIRGRYMWRDLERLCAKHGLPWRRPSVFPRNSVLPARVALASDGTIGAVTRAIFLANFAEDLDISNAAVLAPVVDSAGERGRRTIDLAQTQEVKDR